MSTVTLDHPVTYHAGIQKTPYLANLTPLRGVAALITVFFHFDIDFGWVFSNSGLKFLSRMYLMVDFFFILSGFIMCHVYAKSFQSGVTKAAFKKFTVARFSRVYPLHLVTLLFVIVLFSVTHALGLPKEIVETENSLYSVVTNLFLVHSMNFHKWFTWVHASWSISTEWWAYMIFPFLVLPFTRLKSTGRIIVCLLCMAGYLCITFLLVPIVTVPDSIPFVRVNPADLSIDVSYQYGIVRCLCGFILGMMIYKGYRERWAKKLLGNGTTMLVLTAAMFVCAYLHLPDVITVSFFPLILLCGAYGSKSTDRLFGSKPLQKLGDWSFSIYLVHQPVMYTTGAIIAYLSKGNAAPAGPPAPIALSSATMIMLGMMVLIVFVASLSYKFIEVPARKKLNQLAA